MLPHGFQYHIRHGHIITLIVRVRYGSNPPACREKLVSNLSLPMAYILSRIGHGIAEENHIIQKVMDSLPRRPISVNGV
jgi:hypothetical protein